MPMLRAYIFMRLRGCVRACCVCKIASYRSAINRLLNCCVYFCTRIQDITIVIHLSRDLKMSRNYRSVKRYIYIDYITLYVPLKNCRYSFKND